MKATKTEVIETIQKYDGIVSEVARALGMTPEAIRLRIKKHPELQAAQLEAREALVDKAESQLRKAVDSGAAWATKFVLETWGRGRGFSRQITVENNDDKEIVVLHYIDDGRNPYAPGQEPPVTKRSEPNNVPH